MAFWKNCLAAATMALALAQGHAHAQALEKTTIELSVGGKPLLYYLPLTIAEQKGFFKEEGLTVNISDFKGGAKSLQALMGGSADVVTGAYEHTIRMQVKKQPIIAMIELGRYPAIVVAVRADLKEKVKTVGDLKGMNIGVTAPGSSTHNFVNYLLGKSGVKPDEVSIISVGGGAGAISAVQQKQVDAIVNLDPVISTLAGKDEIVILADSRTEEGMKEIFGASTLPAAVLYAKPDFIAANPNTSQALVNAFHKSLKWLATATPEQVAEVVPAEYQFGDKAGYLEAVRHSLPTYSRDGVITEEGMKAAMLLLAADAEVKDATIDLPATFNGSFVAKANK